MLRGIHESALADIARHRSQIADLHDALNEARANIDEMQQAQAAEQAEAVRQHGITDQARDIIRDLMTAIPISDPANQIVEYRAAIEAAFNFLHPAPEPAKHDA